MPTVLLLDISLSMTFKIPFEIQGSRQLKEVAIIGLKSLVSEISKNFDLEFVSLMTFSSRCEAIVPFTKDFDKIENALQKIELSDSTYLMKALGELKNYVFKEWGCENLCRVILVTDGSIGNGPNSLKNKILEKTTTLFPFPCKFHVISILPPKNLALYEKLLELNNPKGRLWVLKLPLTYKSIEETFREVVQSCFIPFTAQLVCSDLISHIKIFPPPEPFVKTDGSRQIRFKMSTIIQICGFLSLKDVANAPTKSRHLVLPILQPPDPSGEDESLRPYFAVLLHAGLRKERNVALCQLDKEWYGCLGSLTDTNTDKSNLVLYTFEPGLNSVSWLGNFKKMGRILKDEVPKTNFPIKATVEKCYPTKRNFSVWINHEDLKSDINNIINIGKKIPDKTKSFYREINKLRKTALISGYYEVLKRMASALDTECTLLPAGVHPDVPMQFYYVACELRKKLFYETDIVPLQTNFADV